MISDKTTIKMRELLFVILILNPEISAVNDWHHAINVSQSDGVTNSSCWTGRVPCATLTLALQGLQHNSTVIYLHPGIYGLDNGTIIDERYDVAVVGVGGNGEQVIVYNYELPLTKFMWIQNIVLTECNVDSMTLMPSQYSNRCSVSLNIRLNDSDSVYNGGLVAYDPHIVVNSISIYWYGDIDVEVYSHEIHVEVTTTASNGFQLDATSLTSPTNVTVMFTTSLASENKTIVIKPKFTNQCSNNYYIYSFPGFPICINEDRHVHCPSTYTSVTRPVQSNLLNRSFCADNRCEEGLCGNCSVGFGVPINQFDQCVDCRDHWYYGWLIFITVQILPTTIVVLLILIFNIQLTSGSFNGLVLYYQMSAPFYLFIIDYTLLNDVPVSSTCYHYHIGSTTTVNILRQVVFRLPYITAFNLDFTSLLFDYSLCITPYMTPLGAISFQYVIGFYPLILLLVLYGWMSLYHRGFKCVVIITRPIHHCLARFWRMANIEISLIHSFASIYLLCFTQITITSILLLYSSTVSGGDDEIVFYYDATQRYFDWPHCLSVLFAIFVLIFLIFIPTIFIQLYPLKLFHKLLGRLHLRKQILISIGDVFTGAYKNGLNGTYDYRYFAGFYFLLKIFMCFGNITLSVLVSVFFTFVIDCMILIFRPFRRNIHNFTEFLLMFLLLGIISILFTLFFIRFVTLSSCIIALYALPLPFLIGYIIYHVVKLIKTCCLHYKSTKSQPMLSPIENNDDDDGRDQQVEFPDRLENPEDYDEQHVAVAPYELY